MATVTEHPSFNLLIFLAVLIPFVGLIVGIVYAGKSKKADKKLGEVLIYASLAAWVVWFIIFSRR